MKALLLFLLLMGAADARKRFTPEYFVKKHDLVLPVATKELLDVSKHTHKSDTWEYFYIGKSEKLDSVYNYRDLQVFTVSEDFQKYSYKGDTVINRSISIAEDNGDTLTNDIIKRTDNNLTEIALRLKDSCYYYSAFQPWANKRLYDKSKCRGEAEPTGQEFVFTEYEEYIEDVEYFKGKIDSNTIRRYYFNDFDSLVADYSVESGISPRLFNLYTYTKQKKKDMSFLFNAFTDKNSVVSFEKHTYTPANRLHRIYLFSALSFDAPEKGYKLTNYTEYEYDDLGRLVRMTTRVPPDPKYQKKR